MSLFRKNNVALATLVFAAFALPSIADEAGITVVEVPLANTGFENGLTKWLPVPDEFQGQITVVEGKAQSGTKSLRIDGTKKLNSPFLLRESGPLEPGATYRLSAWVRSDDAPKDTDAAVKIEQYNAKGDNTDGIYGRQAVTADGRWTKISVTSVAAHDTTTMRLYARVYGEGVVYFDDVKLEKIGAAPDMLLQANSKRFVIAPDTVCELPLSIQPDKGNQRDLTQGFTLQLNTPGGARTLIPRVRQNADGTIALAAPIPALPDGDYELIVKNAQLQAQPVVYISTRHKNRRPQYLSETGTIMHNGKPFFPIGMYHTEHNEKDYGMLAENGFNAIQGSFATDLNEFKASLDLAAKHGLAVDVPLYESALVKANLQKSLEKIKRFGDHPAIYTWKIVDEPEFLPDIVDEIPAVYRALKAADPNHPLELTLAEDRALSHWANFCDIMQIDRYPVPDRPLTDVSDFSRNALQTQAPWQNLTYVVQCGWIPDLKNQPTVAQARSMVYLALISGAKGIFWYSMYDPNWDLTKTPFWPKMKGINQEIQQLSLPLLQGKLIPNIESDNANVHVRGLQHEGKLYLLLTNPENTAASVTLTLPKSLKVDKMSVLGEKTATPVAGNKLKLNFGPIDSRTLLLTLKP